MNKLTIHVQTDRLPNVQADDGSGTLIPWAQVTLKVSAVVTGSDALSVDVSDELLPWKWRKVNDTAASWDAHDPAAWAFWSFDPVSQSFTQLVPDAVRFARCVWVPPEFDNDASDPSVTGRFGRRVADEIAAIVANSGFDAALRHPDDNAPTTGRTVFGLVESMSGLPFPAPAGLMVVTAIRFAPPPDPTHLLLAAPVFASANQIAYYLNSNTLAARSDLRSEGATIECLPAENATFENAIIEMRASLPENELPPAEDDDQRLIDLASMVIRTPSGQSGVEASDWVAGLPGRIGEAIDPYARLLAVFDDTVSQALAEDDASAQAAGEIKGALRRALEADFTAPSATDPPPYRLLKALDWIAWHVIGLRLMGSAVAPAPLPILLHAIAERSAPLANTVIERLAAAAAGGDALPDNNRSSLFVAFAATRLARLAGVPTDALPDEVAAADRPEGFMASVVRHWTASGGRRVNVAAGSSYTLSARRVVISKTDSAWPPHDAEGVNLATVDEPLFDSAGLSRIAWRVMLDSVPATGFSLDVSLAGTSPASIARIEGAMIDEGVRLSLVLEDGPNPTTLLVQAGSEVSLELELFDRGGQKRLSARLASETSNSASIEAPAAYLARSPFSFLFRVEGAGLTLAFPVSEQSIALGSELQRRMPPYALRAELARAHAGPYVEGIIAGREVWNGQGPPASGAPAERIRKSIEALTRIGTPRSSLFTRLLDEALKISNLPERDATASSNLEQLRDLMVRLMTDAAAGAAVLARNLVPSTADGSKDSRNEDQARRLTADATPLVMRIDQMQTFDTAEDLWSRISGIGVLLARTRNNSDVPTHWYSLNSARLHISETDRGIRKPLGSDNAVRVAPGSLDEKGALVDPVAQQVAEINGIRSALISYNNRSLVATMENDQALAPSDNASAFSRRVEAYGAPPKASGIRLPALTFGHVFHLCPYVLGQGAALPPWLRHDATKPFERIADPRSITPPSSAIRRVIYRRTRAVGAPVLIPPRVLPGVPEGVAALAGELSIRPPPVTIGLNVDGRFFLSEDGATGVIQLAPVATGEQPGLLIEIGDVTLSAAVDVVVRLHGRPTPGDEPRSLAELTVRALAAHTRLRVEAFDDGWRYWTAAVDTTSYAEEEPQFVGPTAVADPHLNSLVQWRDIAVHVIVGEAATASFEPPIVTLLTKVGESIPIPLGRPQIAPESNHTQRSVHVLDGIEGGVKLEAGRDIFTLNFRRPAVDYGTFERWLNATIFERLAGASHVDTVLPAAERLSDEEDKKSGEKRSLDDPSVTGIYVELVRVFPTFQTVALLQAGSSFDTLEQLTGFTSAGQPASRLERSVRVEKARSEELLVSGSLLIARLLPGKCYELRIYGGVPTVQPSISAHETAKRFSQAVRGVMRNHNTGAGDVRLGAPLVLTFEVATEKMPEQVYAGEARTDVLAIELLRPPVTASELAHVALAPGFAYDRYPALRYCSSVGLIPQRWSWRGRPQDDDWFNPGSDDRFDIAFSDRRVDDIGVITSRRLERAHVFNGRSRLERLPRTSPPQVVGPTLFVKDLDWQAGIALWRFGLRFESRYAAMRPGDPRFVAFSHRAEGKRPIWTKLSVGDRATGRTPKRPGFALALPLTEPAMAPGAVPPLLLLFDEGFHANFHAGDDVEIAIEVARHPFTERERTETRLARLHDGIETLKQEISADPPTSTLTDKKDSLMRAEAELALINTQHAAFDRDPAHVANLKYWQEHGPDPVRSAAGSEGALLPIRVDGPIGYTFDVGTEAGRFDHSGFLVSPVRLHRDEPSAAWPWSLVKLRCRRLEAPEGIDPSALLIRNGFAAFAQDVLTTHDLLAPGPIPVRDHPIWRVANSQAQLASHPPTALQEGVFATEHEGLVIDIPNLHAIRTGSVKVSFADEPQPKLDPEVAISVAQQGSNVMISLSTALGPAGSQAVTFRPDQRGQLRLVVSLRDKPQEGKLYRPAGDISVRLRLTGGEGLVHEAADRWISIASIPLVSSHLEDWHAIASPVKVQISLEGDANEATARPVRLSGFTPSVWCQFTESMSVFQATEVVHDELKPIPGLLAHTDLMATLGSNATRMTLALKPELAMGRTLAGLRALDTLASETDTAQVEEVLAVLVTRFVRDVFDRIRERPVAVKVIGEAIAEALTIDLATAEWPPVPPTADALGPAGRVRILRLLRPKRREQGGFIDGTPPQFPQDYFDPSMLEAPLEMNPADAKGVLLGMSMPIEWRRPSGPSASLDQSSSPSGGD